MGRKRKRTVKHRRKATGSTGDNTLEIGAVKTIFTGEITGESTGGTGQGSGDSVPAVVETVDRLAPEQTAVETLTQLEYEAAAAMADAPVDPGPATGATGEAPPPAGPSVDDMAKGYAMLGTAALDMVFELGAPNWEVTDSEKSKLGEALGKACALWFPGEIPEKWVALIVVAGAAGEIIAKRRDPSTGTLKPRFRTVTIEQPPKASE